MNTYLIDDESNCTEVLEVLLQKYCPSVKIGGIFNDPEQALDLAQDVLLAAWRSLASRGSSRAAARVAASMVRVST